MTGPTDFAALLRRLLVAEVEFILVGGVAGNVHGSARATYDIGVVYRRTPENLTRIVGALRPIEPYLRGAPPGLPLPLPLTSPQSPPYPLPHPSTRCPSGQLRIGLEGE